MNNVLNIIGVDGAGNALAGVQIRVSYEDQEIAKGTTRGLHKPFSLQLPEEYEYVTLEAAYQGETLSENVSTKALNHVFHFSPKPHRSVMRRAIAITAVLLLIGLPEWFWFRHKPDPERLESRPQYIGGDPSGKPVVVVFVHGIFGSAKDTWTGHGTSIPELLEDDPSLGPEVDSFVYEYYSPYLSDSAKITTIAEDLRTTLEYSHVWDKHQKVIFVAHSMGGLIVRQYLAAHPDHLGQIQMLFFYATPTEGSDLASKGKWISANPQLAGMEPIGINTYLDGIKEIWLGNPILRGLPTYCAYETIPIPHTPDLVVSEESASLLCNSSRDPISRDHIEIVKPDDRQDRRYQLLAWTISSNLRSAHFSMVKAPAPLPPSPRSSVAVPKNQAKREPVAPITSAASTTGAQSAKEVAAATQDPTPPPKEPIAHSTQVPTAVSTPAPPNPQSVILQVTPELVRTSLRRFVSSEKFPHSRKNVYWYIWLDLPAPVRDQLSDATYTFDSNYIPGEISSDINPSKAEARFGAEACDQSGRVVVALKNHPPVTTDFDLCSVEERSSRPH